MTDSYPTIEERRRRTHRTLIYVILGTLPCYFCGIVLLVGFSGGEGRLAPTPSLAVSETPAVTETITETPTITPGGPTLTLPVTPTQFEPETSTPTLTPTITTTPDLDATATVEALLTQGANSLTATAVAPTQQMQATQTQQALDQTATANANATATANANATATANANATATANANATATANANLTATAGANQPPTANADSASTGQGEPVDIDVLSNDTDPNGDSLTISDYDNTSGEGGTVDCSGGAQCRYTPAGGFSGTDLFSYTVSDGRGGTDTATVTVTVEANQPPTANDDSASTTEGSPVAVDVLNNDSDPNGDDLTINSFTQPDDGTVEQTGPGRLRYTPDGGFTGGDSFNYTISDGNGGTDSATVTITVNAP
jgi:hypothetical protein